MKYIAITGHRPDAFLISHYSNGTIKRIADDLVATYKREHKNEVTFLLGGAAGTDLWVGEACINNNVSFELFIPFTLEVFTNYWSEDVVAELKRQCNYAKGIWIVDPSGAYNVQKYQERNKKIVDQSNLVVAFWVGKRSGGTYNTIKYALQSKKTVLNALNELRPIFSEDLVNGWTPPTVGGDHE